MRRLIRPTVLLCIAGLSAPALQARQVGELSFEKCELPVVGMRPSNPLNAECTTLKVQENWDDPASRSIELAIALVPSRAPKPKADPVFMLAGGPGQSARESWRAVASSFKDVLAERHVILLDQRGTGGSNRFDCPMPKDYDPLATTVDPALAAQSARECVAAAKDSHDARYYTTEDAARDLDQVRQRLGATQINLVGVSYGTRMAQIYYKRYPAAVRSMVLDSVVPNDLALGTEHAINLDAALRAQLGRCTADADCQKAFGDPYATLMQMAKDLAAAPRMITVRDPRTGEAGEHPLSPSMLASVARLYTYQTEMVALLPVTLKEAQAGRYEPLIAQALMINDDLGSQLSSGMHWSILCAEDAPLYQPRPQDAGLLLGEEFITTTMAFCAEWPKRSIGADYHAPAAGDVPTLILSGEFDPVTPPRYGDQVAKGLSHARHLVVPGQGHSVMGRGCGPKLVSEFIKTADAKALDADCLSTQTAAPFFLNLSGSAP